MTCRSIHPSAAILVAAALAITAATAGGTAARADESVIMNNPPVMPAVAPAPALEEPLGPWMIRVRALGVLPDESANIPGVGGSVDIDNAFVPEIDFTYFFTENLAAELIVATTPHDVHHTPTNLALGKTWLLPPTLTVQYHFLPENKYVRPYAGIGINYTIFYDTHDEAPGLDVHYHNAWGWALQGGFDVPITRHLGFNVDVKKIFLDTQVQLSGLVNSQANVDIDPWVVGVGLSYRF